MTSLTSSRLGFQDTLAILQHDFFELLDLDSIFQQRMIPSYLPPDPGLVSPYLDSTNDSTTPTLSLNSCLKFKDFSKENQDIFQGF
jgi:hypothetical protein